MPEPALSVIVAARDPWPALRESLDALYPQIGPVGGEIVVAVSDPRVIPPDAAERYPAVTWLQQPNGSVFSLRALAMAHARADVVAVTEDHAWVAPDWCRRVLEAHAEHPAAAAVGGVVENGATATLVDWASFFVANGPSMPPITSGRADTISLQANVSYKRRALVTGPPALGFMPMILHRDLAADGAALVADDRLLVTHVQALGWREHTAGHFHNGRTIAASRLSAMSPAMRALRALGCFVLPPVMLVRTLRTIAGKRRHRKELIASVPLMVWLLCCHALGELFGYAAGPGDSPRHVR
jgi:hypothetical protein